MMRFTVACSLFVVAGLLAVLAAPGNLIDAKLAAEAENRFGLDLYGQVAVAKGNLFFSPLSIHAALAMAFAGARGDTAAEMAKTLHLPGSGAERLYRALTEALSAGSKVGSQEVYRLFTANSLWVQQGYEFEKAYLDLVKADFGGELVVVDFEKATEAARAEINAWVEKRTSRKIRDLIPAGMLRPLTRLVLANAIYMESAWDKRFEPELTVEAPFHLDGERTVKAQLMHRLSAHRYFEGDGFQAVTLSYAANRLSMTVFLPAENSSLAAFEKKLALEGLTCWLDGMKSRPVDLALPRFKMTSARTIAEALRALGMEKALKVGEADFTGIASTRELFIGQVVHKAYVDVNEEGTEAAAATAVDMLGSAAPGVQEKPVVFKADRPFLFLIRHEQTGTILFMGRVTDPTARE